MIMLMIMPLSWQVFADDVSPEVQEASAVQSEAVQPEPTAAETAAAPEPVKTEPAAPAAEAAEPAPAEESAAPEAVEAPAAEAAEEPEPEGGSEPAVSEEETTGTVSAPAEENAASAPAESETESPGTEAQTGKKITIAGTKLDGNSDSSGSGWTYEKDSGRIVLRNFAEGADISSDGTGVEIVLSGFNKIGTLSCDGQIDVIGTGILLIDNIELAEGADFNLHPIKEYYGEDGGSVAVFLMQKNGSYKLINGSVTGVIDEKIDVPDKTTLVLPAGTTLDIKADRFLVNSDEDGNKTIRNITNESLDVYKSKDSETVETYIGGLSVSDLIVNAGALVIGHSIGIIISSSIDVHDRLVNKGTIRGGEVLLDGDYSGSGSFENADIWIGKDQELTITIKDSTLKLSGSYTIKKISSSGASKLVLGGNSEIRNVKLSSGDTLQIHSLNPIEQSDIIRLTGSVDGGSVLFRAGIAELGKNLKFLNGGTISNIYQDIFSGAPVFNYSSLRILMDGITNPVFFGPNDITMPDKASIPVTSFYLYQYKFNGIYELSENYKSGMDYHELDPFDAAANAITYDKLYECYAPDESERPEGFIAFEIFSRKKGKLSRSFLIDGDEYSVDPEGVFLIRMAYMYSTSGSVGGSSKVSTRADQTGSGTIGGNPKSIMTGTGRKKNSDPVDPVKPDPVKPDDPDPSRPANEYKLAAVKTVSDTLALQINEFDLNEGDENAEKVPYYNLSAYINGAQVSELSAPVKVEMDYVLPEEYKDKPLYAVFANEDETSDETLTAVNAEYDEETGTLTFETSQVGEFMIVAFEFDGEEFSPEFYGELEKIEAVKLFIKHLEEKKDNAGL